LVIKKKAIKKSTTTVKANSKFKVVVKSKKQVLANKPFSILNKKITSKPEFGKFDLHIHSKFSPCAVIEPETIVRKAKEAGLRGFAITDHNTIRAWPELTKLAKENDLIFVPGQEIDVTFNGKKLGHLLALFTYDKITSSDIYEVVDEARSQSALLSLPHMFDSGRYFKGIDILMSNGPLSRYVPAVETFNSRVLTSCANDLAKDFAHKHGLLQTAGSDAHMPYEIGNGYVIAKAETELELLREIKLGRVVVNGQLSGIGPRIHTLGAYLNIVKDKMFK
jgi:hypothetical protein